MPRDEIWHALQIPHLASRLGVDEGCVSTKEISSGGKMAKEKQPRLVDWAGVLARAGSIWNGLKSNLPDRLEFLGRLPKKKSGE